MISLFTSVGPSQTNFVENFLQQSEHQLLKYRYKEKLGTKYVFGVSEDHEIEVERDLKNSVFNVQYIGPLL